MPFCHTQAPLRSKGFCSDFAEICVAEITFLFCWLCYLAKHWQHTKVTTEFPILLRQLLSLCCEHLQAAKTAVVSGRRDWTGLGILSPPGSQHVALGTHTSIGAAPGGDPASLQGRRKGKHRPPPSCFSWSSREHFQHTLLWLLSCWGLGSDREPSLNAFCLFPAQGDILLLLHQSCISTDRVCTFH